MNTLIDELTTARQSRIRAPLCLVAWTSAVSVSRTNEHHRTECPGLEQLSRLAQRRVIPMIETNPHLHPGRLCGFDDRVDFRRVQRPRFLDQDVLARFDST